ncbi:MAG: acetyl-CoA carboxylase biotin carboxyl carrier protein [Eubacterium sp.]
MESMEMFNEILKDFKQSDLISMDVEMPGIRLSVKRESAPAGPAAEGSMINPGSRNAALSSDTAEHAGTPASSYAGNTENSQNPGARTGAGNDAANGSGADVSMNAGRTAETAGTSVRGAGSSGSAESESRQDKTESILCPLVGVFYSASSPDAEAFVHEGQRVKEGEVMCIIEAMKSMNELKAPYDLKVKKVCIENGDMAEFHQVLFEVEKC